MITKITKKSSTNFPMLMKVVEMSGGPVMEIGSSASSTPLLHWLCKERNLKLVTYERNPDNFEFAKDFKSRNHIIRLIGDSDKIDTESHWGVVLINQSSAEQMGIDIIRLQNNADYIVLPDSEKEVSHGYDKIWEHFDYRYDWKDCKPWTTVISNFKDLKNLQKATAYRQIKWIEISRIFFIIGSTVSITALIFAPEPYNHAIAALYIVACILNYAAYSARKLQIFKDKSIKIWPSNNIRIKKWMTKLDNISQKYSLARDAIRSWFL